MASVSLEGGDETPEQKGLEAGAVEAGTALPEGTPEKFVTDGVVDVAALTQAYNALEQKQSATLEGEPSDTPPAGPDSLTVPTTPATETTDFDAKFAEIVTKYGEQYQADGKLPEEGYAELQKTFNASPAMVDGWFAGQAALANEQVAAIHGAVGGKQEYTDMIAWATRSLPQAELDAFNKSVNDNWAAGAMPQVELAVRGMAARWKGNTGKPTDMAGVEMAIGAGVQPFASEQEAQTFQSSQLYQDGDPATHKEYDQRMVLAQRMKILS